MYAKADRQIDGQSVLYPLKVSRIEPTLTNNIPVLTQLETKPHAPTAGYLKTRRLHCSVLWLCSVIYRYIYILACFLKSFTVQQPSLFWHKVKDFFLHFFFPHHTVQLFKKCILYYVNVKQRNERRNHCSPPPPLLLPSF